VRAHRVDFRFVITIKASSCKDVFDKYLLRSNARGYRPYREGLKQLLPSAASDDDDDDDDVNNNNKS
jgi:hypothetical protein